MMRRVCLFLLPPLLLLPLTLYAATIQLPRTGQLTSYADGDDGAQPRGVPWPGPRFVDNGDETVTDTLTGLMWEKTAYSGNGSINPYGGISGTYTWQRALDTAQYYNSTNHLGYSDWRLPTLNELKSLLDVEHSSQADWLMSQGFVSVLPRTYWTSTTEMSTRTSAYIVDMSSGMISMGTKSLSQSYIWYVRGAGPGAVTLPRTGQKNCWGTDGSYRTCSGSEDGAAQSGAPWPTPRFTDHSKTDPSDLTVTDNLTGVIWSKSGGLTGPKTWQQALDYVQGLNNTSYLGHADWRLPNRTELESLAQLNYVNTAFQLTQQGFAAVYATQYWSSSTRANDAGKAWAVDMNRSFTLDFGKTAASFYVWPVRGGQGGAPLISLSPAGNDFGTVTTNAVATRSFSVANSGTAPLTLGGFILTGDSASFLLAVGDGSAGSCGPAHTLFPGGSCSISATFAPPSSGAKAATVRITSNDAASPTKDLPLTGTAVDPSYLVSTSVIGGGGNITCDSPVVSGRTSVCSIAPGPGFRLATFTDNGADRFASVSSNRYSIYNVIGDHAVQGSFAPNTPVITWGAPADIVYGTALSAAQLNATAAVSGTFHYTPGAGLVLGAGRQTLSVTFTPTDPSYVTATKTVTLNVAKAVPAIGWADPGAIVYGTSLSLRELAATADVPGTFAYAPGVGTVLPAGMQPLSVTFTPTDAADYTAASKTVTLSVMKAAPVLTWRDPAGVVYGTPLSAAQLDASADVSGTFAYAPGAGAVLNAGIQPLTVTFTPDDSADYINRSATVFLAVAKANQTITFPPIEKMSFKDAGFDPGATASSGLPVIYASSDTAVAVPSGGVVEIIGGGNAVITAHQPGNVNYNPAPPQSRPVKVTGRRSQLPGLTIGTLPDGATTSDAALPIVGTVSRIYVDGTVAVRVTNNGTTASFTVPFAFPSGDFSLTVPLGAGENVVEIVAVSKFGVSTDRRTITCTVQSR